MEALTATALTMSNQTDSSLTRVKPAKRRLGRPVKRTPERLAKFKALLESGLSIRGSALSCGLSESCVYRWRDTDPAFEELVQSAMAESEHRLVGLALEGAKKDGRIALMMLERRFPESWAKRTEHIHAHAHGEAGTLLAELVAGRKRRDAALGAVTVTAE